MAILETNIGSNIAGGWLNGLLAGLAGGAAEVGWIALYSGLTGGDGIAVANGVTASVVPAAAGTALAVPLGLAIHFGLAIALGLAVAVMLRRIVPQLAGSMAELGLIVAVLATVWAVNFLIILPVLNPAFVHVVPLPVSFISKLLFGLAAALVLRMKSDRSAQQT